VNVVQTVAEAGFDNLFRESLPDQIISEELLCAPKALLFRNAAGVFTQLTAKLIPGLLSTLCSRWPCRQVFHARPRNAMDSSSFGAQHIRCVGQK
jgi:hypothetical protein